MLELFSSWFGSRNTTFCTEEFPKVWTDFVDCFVDTVLAGGPTITSRPLEQVKPQPTVLPAVPRLVAIGDLHGDLGKTRRAFRLGGLTDANDRWIGGTTTAVQVGDQLDRGNDEVRILYFLERLEREAEKAGGKLHILNGNHETMNVAGRFTYATLPGLADFYQWQLMQSWGSALKAKCGCSIGDSQQSVPPPRSSLDNTSAAAARRTALSPGGAVTTRFLADHPIALQVGSTVFVHGGVLPQHADLGLERINQETRAWMRGETLRMPSYLSGRQAIVWAREYSAEDRQRCECDVLEQALAKLPGAKRMVVGHTIQDAGINSACDERVFRIDVGLSKGCGDGDPQVLEILNDTEVWQRQENGPPKYLGSVTGLAAQKQSMSWWQRRGLGQKQQQQQQQQQAEHHLSG